MNEVAIQINPLLIKKVNEEMAKTKGQVNDGPDILLNSAVEALGEVAHAINHNEGLESVEGEIVKAIGVLARLYDMAEIYIRPQPVPSSPELIIKAVLMDFKINYAQIKGKGRQQSIVLGRQIAMYLMRQHTDLSLEKIGQELGGRSPATVSHAYHKIAEAMIGNVELRHRVQSIEFNLRRHYTQGR